MPDLSFKTFLAKYVRSLSATGTVAIKNLVKEASSTNARLREPLFLYALAYGKMDLLLRLSRATSLFDEYKQLSDAYTYKDILSLLESQSPLLRREYLKVWTSYKAAAGAKERDRRVRDLVRERIRKMQKETGISAYRIAKDLNLDPANVASWLKNGNNAVGLQNACLILDYLEDFEEDKNRPAK